MILLTTDTTEDPRLIRIEKGHPLYWEDKDTRNYERHIALLAKEHLPKLKLMNRNGVLWLSSDRQDVTEILRRHIYKGAKSFLDAPAEGRKLCSVTFTMETYRKFTIEHMGLREDEFHAGWIMTPELSLNLYRASIDLDVKKHYEYADKHGVSISIRDIVPHGREEYFEEGEYEKLCSKQLDFIHLPLKKKLCTTHTTSLSEPLW